MSSKSKFRPVNLALQAAWFWACFVKSASRCRKASVLFLMSAVISSPLVTIASSWAFLSFSTWTVSWLEFVCCDRVKRK